MLGQRQFMIAALAVAGCGGGEDTGGGTDVGVTAGVPAPSGGAGGEPVGAPGGALAGGSGGSGGESAGGSGGEPAGGAGGEPAGGSGGAGGTVAPPPGELPPFEHVAVTSAGDWTYVFWGDAGGLHVRRFGDDLAWSGPAALVAPAPPEQFGVAARSVAGVPCLAWGSAGDAPIRILAAERAGDLPTTLGISGRPLLTPLGDRLLVVGRDPAGAVAWQLVEPAGGTASPAERFEGPTEGPDSAGTLGETAILRFGRTGHCLALDADGRAFVNFPCRTGAEGFIASDDRGGRIVEAFNRAGERYREVLPLPGAGAFAPYVLGKETRDTVSHPFPGYDGTRPLILASVRLADEGRTVAVFPESDRLFRTVPSEGWAEDGARALVRRGDRAIRVRFGEADGPRLSAEPVDEVNFEGRPYSFVRPPLVPADCQPAVEDCAEADLDCDGRPDDGLCCGSEPLRWSRDFEAPPGPNGPLSIRKFFLGDVPNRDAYFMAAGFDDDSVRAYLVDFTDREGDVSAEAGQLWEISAQPRTGEVRFDLSLAHDLQGYVQVAYWRGVLARNRAEGDRLGVFWNPPTRRQQDDTPAFSPLEGCDEVLAYDRVSGDLFEAGEYAAVVVCRDRILRLPPSFSGGEPQTVLLEAPGGLPVRAEWATVVRANRQALMILVGYRTPEGTLELLRFLASPLPVAGAPAGVAAQPVGGGALGSLEAEDRASPIYWNAANSAYVQRLGANEARVLVPDGENWTWANPVLPTGVARLELADLDSQLIAGGPLPDGGYGFAALSLGGAGGTNLWAPLYQTSIPSGEPLWQVTRGAANDDSSADSNGKRYPGILTLSPHPERPGEYRIELVGLHCAAP